MSKENKGSSRSDKSLATLRPDTLAYWDSTLNTKDPYVIGARSAVKTWWKCLNNDSHIWDSSPDNITKRPQINCPYCTLKRLHADNSLSVLYPKLAAEFHSDKNSTSPAQIIGNASSVKYWWICADNHEWEASLGNRVRLNSGCPACSGRVAHDKNNLAVLYPEIAKEFDVVKNGKEAHEFVGGSDIHVWWICSAKRHEWKTAVSTRTKLGSGCPYCTNQKINDENSLQALFPEIAKEFNAFKNDITANQVGAGALKWVWWKCAENHEWESAISNRTSQKLGCPKCSLGSTSKIEKLFRSTLSNSGYFTAVEDHGFRIRTSVDKRKFIEIDVLAYLNDVKIGIEYDGSYYHRNKTENDIGKTKKLIEMGYVVVRIREQSPSMDLPLLDFKHEKFLQVKHVYNARNPDISGSISVIIDGIKEMVNRI